MNNIQLPETFTALSHFRKNDIYLPEMDENRIISDFFPGTFTELVQRLSDITGVFYGGLLKQSGKLFGDEAIQQLSSAFMYDLGTKMTLRTLGMKPELPFGIPSAVKIIIGAVFTSSPEYSFEFKELNDHKVEMLIKGIDRYHKITKNLEIENLLQWPVIQPFIQGVCDTMGLDVLLNIQVLKLNPDSSCVYWVVISEK